MLIYFALKSQTQKPLHSIILHKIIFVNVLHFDQFGLWMSQISFFTSMDCKREIIYYQYNFEIYLPHS